jgi:hypothetical protein
MYIEKLVSGELVIKKHNTIYYKNTFFYSLIDFYYYYSNNYSNNYSKKFIIQIDSIVYITTGNSIMSNFITKYHDSHKLNLYRLIKINESTNSLSSDIIKNVLNTIGIDILCVASHYSERYGNSDNYITRIQNTKDENNITNNVLYFVENPLKTIINNFIEQCVEVFSLKGIEECEISWKNMHYIWKLYLSHTNIPNMIYSQQLQFLLMSTLKYKIDSTNIIFTNITSKYLPSVSTFLSFWDKHIVITNDSNYDDEYEIDELTTLYKNYDKKNNQMSDMNMIKMICHYFSPQVEVIDNKYIT